MITDDIILCKLRLVAATNMMFLVFALLLLCFSISFPSCSSRLLNSTDGVKWTSEVCNWVLYETNLVPDWSCGQGLGREEIPADKFALSSLLVTGTARSGTTFLKPMTYEFGFPLADDNGIIHREKHSTNYRSFHITGPSEYGMVSWRLAAKERNSHHFHNNINNHYRFYNLIHLVRDPLDTIRSLRTELKFWQTSRRFSRELFNIAPKINAYSINGSREDHLLLFGLRYWVEWHTRIDKHSLGEAVVQVENICEENNLKYFFDFTRTYTPERLKNAIEKCSELNDKYHGTNSREVFQPEDCTEALKKAGKRCYYSSNGRPKWQALLQIDPEYALQAYKLAIKYGYMYDNEVVPSEWLIN